MNPLVYLVLIEVLAPPVLLAIASSSEEEKLELDYADDPPMAHVKGTAQGQSSSNFHS